MNTYPEHEKLQKVKDKSQAIGEFLGWLGGEKKIQLCTYEEARTVQDEDGEKEYLDEGYYVIYTPKEIILAEYFGIDLDVLEKEKRAMLDKCRSDNEVRNTRGV